MLISSAFLLMRSSYHTSIIHPKPPSFHIVFTYQHAKFLYRYFLKFVNVPREGRSSVAWPETAESGVHDCCACRAAGWQSTTAALRVERGMVAGARGDWRARCGQFQFALT